MDDLVSRIKTQNEDFEVDYDISPITDNENFEFPDYDFKDSADAGDYAIAVSCGISAGVIDILYVGEFSIDGANAWGSEQTNKFVMKISKKNGYKGDSLSGAVKYLENEYKIPADSATALFGCGRQHHLRDFSHHPTPVGLLFSILTQFTKNVYGTDTAGNFIVERLPEKGLAYIGEDFPDKIFLGIVHWFFIW